MDKVITIIVPAYNMESYISKCLDSLLVHSLEKVQILVINDGSKDSTSEIAHEYSEKYPASIQVIDKPNGNYGSCINCGLAMAVGKYVKVLDSDDSFISSNFEDFIVFLNNIDADIVFSDFIQVDEFGTETSAIKLPLKISEGEIVSTIGLLDNIHKLLQMHSVTYKTDLLKSIKYTQTEGISFTDQEWIFLPTAYSFTATYFHKPIYRYLVGRLGQTICESFLKRQISLQRIYNRQINQYEALSSDSNISSHVINYMYERLKFNLDYLYRNVLLYEYNSNSFFELKKFDQDLRCNHEKVTGIIDSIVVHPNYPFHFCMAWYKSNYKINLSLALIRKVLQLRKNYK